MTKSVDSASDERTANNLMRHQYRLLTEPEKRWMQKIKDMGFNFVRELHVLGGSDIAAFDRGEDGVKQASRELSIAQTKMEEATMWAVKHLTR